MNPEVKKQWVDALRSCEYKQAKHALRGEDGFCCLGVLCDLHAKATGTPWLNERYLDKGELLPHVVVAWAGLSEVGRFVKNHHTDTAPSSGYTIPVTIYSDSDEFSDEVTDLAEANDDGNSFATIASLIEEQL